MIFISKNEKGIPAWKLIKQGKKIVTRRLKPEPVGAIRAVCPGRGKKAVCYIKILSCEKHTDWLRTAKRDRRLKPLYAYRRLMESEAKLEGFDRWYHVESWLESKKIDVYKTYRIEFVRVE